MDIVTGTISTQQAIEVEVRMLQYQVHQVNFSPDSKLLAFGSERSEYQGLIWNAETGELQRTVESRGSEETKITFSPHCDLLALDDDGGMLEILEVTTGTIKRLINYGEEMIRAIAFSTDGQLLASASLNWIKISDVTTGVL